MHIAYCTNVRLPSERAHGHQVAQVCHALTQLGHTVTILAPYRRNSIKTTFNEYYQVSPQIHLKILGTFDAINRIWLPGVLGLWVVNMLLRRNLSRFMQKNKVDVLYTRSPALLHTLLQCGVPTIVELHALPRFFRSRFISQLRHCIRVVCLTEPMRKELLKWGVPKSLLCTEPDGVNSALFETLPGAAEARQAFKLAPTDIVVGYAGSLSTMGLSKGVEVVVEAIALLQKDYPELKALIAGGPESSVAELRALAVKKNVDTRIAFLGQVPHNQVPVIYSASDILVYPAPASNHPYFRRDTSPLKILEYMVTKKPIISADLPPVHDILSEKSAIFFAPGNPSSLAEALRRALSNPTHAASLAANAASSIPQFLWTARMTRILSSAL